METVIERLRSPWVIAYVDDVIVHTLDLQQHMEELRTVFKAHQDSGIRLNAKKTILCTAETDYLGYRITTDGIHMK